MLSGQRAFGAHQLCRRSLEDDPPAVMTSAGTHVDHPVSASDDVKVVLDDDDRPPRLDQPIEQSDEVVDVLHVQAGRGLVEDIDLGVRRHLDRKLQPLALATGQGVELLAERDVAEPDVGQPAPTLSGGEAQRVKLASELQKRSTGRTVYVLDEPTTGLHFEDVRKLLGVLQSLVDKGNTVIVIEHNLDVVKTADWIIDMGPEGGSGGGTVVAEGTPEEIAAVDSSHTGVFLRHMLEGGVAKPASRKKATKKAVSARAV